MTRDEAKQLLPIIQAYSEGKEVEYDSDCKGAWMPTPEPSFNPAYRYRIKPEPIECWVALSGACFLGAYAAYEHAALAAAGFSGRRVIRMREVHE